jgi:hypothetical protein
MPVGLKWTLALVIGAVIGLALGSALGWLVWPVEYYDTDLYDLSAEDQATYVQMVSEQWELTGDVAQARTALALLGEDEPGALALAVRHLEDRGQTTEALRVLKLSEALKKP